MTRDEIIKELRCLASGEDGEDCPSEKCDNTCPYWTEIERGAALYDDRQLCRAAADMLEQDAKKASWISVKERMPESGEKVIVFAIGKYDGFIGDTVYAMSMILDRPSGKSWAVPWQYFDVDYEITHWMLLPEPPKEEKA